MVAVLVRDAAGNLVDFVCAFDANPTQITNPMLIPAPMEAAMPTRKASQLFLVAKAAAKSGAPGVGAMALDS